LESYQRIAKALLHALHLLNIRAQSTEQPNSPGHGAQKGPVCFEVPSNYEITFNGKKLIGSAQARKKMGVLQHGSFPLYGNLSRITVALRFADENQRQRAAQRLLARATTAQAALGRRIEWEQAVEAFVEGFQTELRLDLQRADLTPQELSRAERLVQTKYAHPDWTARS